MLRSASFFTVLVILAGITFFLRAQSTRSQNKFINSALLTRSDHVNEPNEIISESPKGAGLKPSNVFGSQTLSSSSTTSNDTSQKVQSAIDDSESIGQAWVDYRDAMYDQIGLDATTKRLIDLKRLSTSKLLQNLATRLQTADRFEATSLVNKIEKLRNDYDLYIQSTLGPESYDYIQNVQGQFNDEFRGRLRYPIKIGKEW